MIKKIFIKYIYKQIKILNSSHQIFKYSFESKKLVALVSLVSRRGKWPRSIVLQLNILSTIQKRIALCCPISICRDTSLIFLLARSPRLHHFCRSLSFSHGALIARLNYISREEDVPPRGASRQNEFTLSFTFVKLVPPRRLN